MHKYPSQSYLSPETRKDFDHIAAVHHVDKVMETVKKLREVPGVDSSAVNIVSYSNDRVWLSTTPAISVEYIKSGYQRGDAIFAIPGLRENKVFYEADYNDFDDMQRESRKLRDKYNLHQGYHFSRRCSDCIVVTTCNAVEPVETLDEQVAFYEQTVFGMEEWLNYFLDHTIDIYCEYLPEIAKTRFATESNFRHQVITTREHAPIKLNRSERNVLYWSAMGKTADEIAIILDLSPETITTYRKSCIKTLGANNITHAIHLAQLYGLIS